MDSSYCQTFAVSPAEPGDFPLLVKYLEDLNALHAIHLAAAEKIKDLENTSGDAWETAKDTTDKIWDDLRTGLAGADFKFE